MKPQACEQRVASIIPRPVHIVTGQGVFHLTAETIVRSNSAVSKEARLLKSDLSARRGAAPMRPCEHSAASQPPHIALELASESSLPAAGYCLDISPTRIKITGKDAAGVFYGTRTLLQLLPTTTNFESAEIPAMTITDHPRFAWRGMMIDSARHFIEVDHIKSFLDWMAFHKLNNLHWHLSDDQGWRIEIKKYPKLTEVGAYRESTPPYGDRKGSDHTRYGAFYTQQQIQEVVRYAAERHITVLPEIDMPGHMAAATAAYPYLGNSDLPDYAPKVQNHWGIHPYTLAPTEAVFEFVDDIFTEVCALFPSTYIHMGGDEAPKTQWEASPRVQALMQAKGLKDGHEVQSYFVKRVEKILASKGRKLIGWDEIREGGLSPQASVMSWRGEAGGIASAQEGHDVVMCPQSHMYFDYYQAPAAQELAKGAEFQAFENFLPLQQVYQYDPVPAQLSPQEATHILGVQANLWSEFIKDFKKMQYQAFPRIAALAEVAWSPAADKDYANFLERLEDILAHYQLAQINCGPIYTPAPQDETPAKS